MVKAATILEKNKMKIKIKAISISGEKGVQKENVKSAVFIEDFGIENDAHAGNHHRQVSLLAVESINKIKKKLPDIKPGAFAENITTEGINLIELRLGTVIKMGENVLIEITQKGKECHTPCKIYYAAGDCVMPREGIFARVIKGGIVNVGDNLEVVDD